MKKDLNPQPILVLIKKIGRPVFTTHEMVSLSGKSSSTVTQCLGRLVHQGLLIKVYRGIWAESRSGNVSPFEVLPCLLPRHRVYVSFLTALHLHGMVEQIPQVITLASTAHTKTLRTRAGVFSVHQIAPVLFDGFNWYKEEGGFLVATPEKAIVDSLYLSSRRKKQFGFFPELSFPKQFRFKKAGEWIDRIPEKKIRLYVRQKLERLRAQIGTV